MKKKALETKNKLVASSTKKMVESGMVLNTKDELKMLRVIRWIKETVPICVKATFLGAHAIPEEYKSKPSEYVDIVINESELIVRNDVSPPP